MTGGDAGSRAGPTLPCVVGRGVGSVQLLFKLNGAAPVYLVLTAAHPGPRHLWPTSAAGRGLRLLGSRALVAH